LRSWLSPATERHEKNWDINRPEESFEIWSLMEATDWKYLPYAGGLLDQPDWLLEDIFTLSWRSRYVREMVRDIPVPENAAFVKVSKSLKKG
jgi:hypothetical protein